MAPLIEFNDVTKFYGDSIALFGLSFSVEPGSVYGLLGRNGAGKTTALNMIPGAVIPSMGGVSVIGENPRFLNESARSQIAYAGDNQVLMPHLKVKEVCALAKSASPDWNEKLCRDILDEGGVAMNKLVRTLSKGMKQQLKLALAYAKQPRILVLDEPTEGLDAIVRYSLFSRVLDVVAGGDACVIVSSHILTDVERIIDHVGFISHGRLLYDGLLDDLKEKARRIRIAWSDLKDPGTALDNAADSLGAFSYKKSKRQASFVTGRFNEKWISSFRRQFNSCMIETDPLGLEEIFIEMLRSEA